MKSSLCVASCWRNLLRFLCCYILCALFSSSALAQWVPDNGSGISHVPEKSTDGSVYQFRFVSIEGVNYYIQSSEDLNTWTDDVFYRGLGHTLTHPLFPMPQDNSGNPAPVIDPADYVPLTPASLRMREININGATTGLLIEWVSLDDSAPKSYVLYGRQIDSANPPPLYSRDFDPYSLLLNLMGEITNLNDVPANDTLGTEDAALIGKLVDSLPAINAEITANQATQAAAPPPPPVVGAAKFYRIKKFYSDTDLDGLQDHIEAQQGLNMWNWDTDGDGISDSQDPNPLVNDAVSDPDGAGLDTALETDLLARYDFEFLGSGTFADQSGNSFNANAHGATSIDSHGMVSRAAKLGGTGYLEASSMLHGEVNHSQSFWICPEEGSISNDTTGVYRTIYAATALSGGTLYARFFGVRKFNGAEQWLLGNYTLNAATGYPTSAFAGVSWTMPLGSSDNGQWQHIVTVQSGNIGTVYRNGAVIASGALGAIASPFNALKKFMIGRVLAINAATQYEGKIDRMRIYGKALNATEVTALYHQDIDRDGLWDISENKSLLWRDTNGDGIRTNAESSYSINPYRYDPASSDHDGDGLTSLSEQNTHGTDISNPDTDGDLIPDGWEVENLLDPLADDASGDDDTDGLSNIDEYVYKSDPQNTDTDGDSTSDQNEVTQGSNPHDDVDGGAPISVDEQLTIKIGVGDKSGSESEDYVMNIFRINSETGTEEPFYTLRSGGHGQYEEKTLSIFKKSENYTFQIDWQSSNLGSSSDPNNPDGADFDYTFVVEPQNSNDSILVGSYDPRILHINTGESILGDKNDQSAFRYTIELLRAILIPVKIVPDDDVAGVLGDEVPSNKGAQGERHFVTPVKNDALVATHVTFKAINMRSSWFAQLCEWEGGEAIPGSPHKRKVSRTAPNKEVLKIKYTSSGHVPDQINVWSVKATGTATQQGNLAFTTKQNDTTIDGTTTTSFIAKVDPAHRWRFIFSIQPASIVTLQDDIPDLRGKHDEAFPPPGGNSEFSGKPLSDGVYYKWDVSRRAKDRIINPNLIPKAKMSSGFGTIYNTQPLADSLAFDYPANHLVGNDDDSEIDEEDTPYHAAVTENIAHAIGQISSYDAPNIFLPYAGGAEGYTFQEQLFFGEFARLQIGEKWYRISDFLNWKMIGKFKFTNNKWIDDGSSTGLGN